VLRKHVLLDIEHQAKHWDTTPTAMAAYLVAQAPRAAAGIAREITWGGRAGGGSLEQSTHDRTGPPRAVASTGAISR
jgi:hypothetical protein